MMTKVALVLLIFVVAGCSQPNRGSAAAASTATPAVTAQAAITATATLHTTAIGTATITLAPASGYAGTFIDVSGAGWPASAMVLVKLTDQGGLSPVLAAIAADAKGRFTTGFVYPPGDRWLQPSAQTMLASTEDGNVTATAPFTVAPPAGVVTPTAAPAPTVAASQPITPAVSVPVTSTLAATVPVTPAAATTPSPGITATIAMTVGALAATTPQVAVEPFAGHATTTVTVTGSGFPPNTPINVELVETRKASEPGSLEHIYATATTDRGGKFSIPLVIPTNWPDGTLIPVGQLAIMVATADHRTWASVPFDYLGAALPTPDTATPAPTPSATSLPTNTPIPPTPTNEADQAKVTICHRPPGNPGNAHTITVDQSAVPAHLGHGDTLGACGQNGGNPGASDQGNGKQNGKGKGNGKDKGKDRGKGK